MTTTTIQVRRGTAAAWTAVNPTLGDGEPGLATDSRILKIGDGLTAWNDLTETANPALLDEIHAAVAQAEDAATRAEAAAGSGSGGGGGAVLEVNGQIGSVTLDLDDIPDTPLAVKMTPAERTSLAALPASVAARVRAAGAGVNGRYLGVLTANPDSTTLQTGDWWILVSA